MYKTLKMMQLKWSCVTLDIWVRNKSIIKNVKVQEVNNISILKWTISSLRITTEYFAYRHQKAI